MRLFGNNVIRALEVLKYWNSCVERWEFRWPLVFLFMFLMFLITIFFGGAATPNYAPALNESVIVTAKPDTCYSWDDEWELKYECPTTTPEEITKWGAAMAVCAEDCDAEDMALCMGSMEVAGCTRLTEK